jgi:hypothetical protein
VKRKRADGVLVRGVPAYRRIMPYMMRTRNESAIYWEQTLDLSKTDRFVRDFNEAHPATQITPFHVLLWGAVKGFEKYPNLNRFVAGGGLYQRDGIWLSYSAKRRLAEGSPIIVIKRRFHPSESFEEMVTAMQVQLHEERFGGPSGVDRELGLVLKLPGILRRLGFRLVRGIDAHGLLPNVFIEGDPMYASAFFANLGSIGLDPAYHHLYEYGSIGIFCVYGRPRIDPADPTRKRRTVTLKWTFDERVEDGLYAGYAIKRFAQMLVDPAAAGLFVEQPDEAERSL